MITRIYGKIVFECDSCGDTLETETKEFDEALAQLRRENWKAAKFGDVWQHLCNECHK